MRRSCCASPQESLEKGIAQVRVGARVSDIGHAIQQHVEAGGFSVVREFVGHGIGAALHEDPQIANYGEPGHGPRLAEGMVLAIEPMVNMGKPAVRVLADGWTAVTRDGSLSAHFEHTVAVTRGGPLVLTQRSRRRPRRSERQWRGRPDGRDDAGGVARRRRGSRVRARDAAARAVPGGDRRQRQVTAHVPSGPGRNFIRVLVGDRVRLELSPRDLTRGRIVEKMVEDVESGV